MTMRTILLSTALLLAACSTSKDAAAPAPKQTSADATTVKPGAPSALDALVSGTSAKLTLRFDGPGEKVNVTVKGIDGVDVTSGGAWASGAKVQAGEVLVQTVGFTAAARGHLVVTVEGLFGGAFKSRVHSVEVGEGPVKKDLGAVQKSTDGDAVKLVP